MKNLTKGLIAAIAAMGGMLSDPTIQQAVAPMLAGHKTIVSIMLAAGGIAALVHNPQKGA